MDNVGFRFFFLVVFFLFFPFLMYTLQYKHISTKWYVWMWSLNASFKWTNVMWWWAKMIGKPNKDDVGMKLKIMTVFGNSPSSYLHESEYLVNKFHTRDATRKPCVSDLVIDKIKTEMISVHSRVRNQSKTLTSSFFSKDPFYKLQTFLKIQSR